ncbi:MAG: TatD family hydrolase [Chitinophagaceae bacterium]|nr:TatD family hydrolase [Chitinophagaceae bacterium]
MELIDTHCHLYLDCFKQDIDALIGRARAYGVSRFYLPAIDSSETENMLGLEKKYPGVCIPMMGLHPCSVQANWKEELRHVEEWLARRDFVAIGEIGLDFYWDKTFTSEQYEAFRIQMQWALDRNRPIVIHTRNAMQETIDTVKPYAEKGLRGIFHCFSGDAAAAKQIIDMGFYLGIGGVVTYKNAGLAEALSDISLEHMVLETDAPYLTPVPFRGKRNESSYLQYIVEKLATIRNCLPADVAAATTANAQKIFGG